VFRRDRGRVNRCRIVDARGEGERGVALDAVANRDYGNLWESLACATMRRDEEMTMARAENRTYKQKPFGQQTFCLREVGL
jgi:hypothetical protein